MLTKADLGVLLLGPQHFYIHAPYSLTLAFADEYVGHMAELSKWRSCVLFCSNLDWQQARCDWHSIHCCFSETIIHKRMDLYLPLGRTIHKVAIQLSIGLKKRSLGNALVVIVYCLPEIQTHRSTWNGITALILYLLLVTLTYAGVQRLMSFRSLRWSDFIHLFSTYICQWLSLQTYVINKSPFVYVVIPLAMLSLTSITPM